MFVIWLMVEASRDLLAWASSEVDGMVNYSGNGSKGREGCDGNHDEPWRKLPAEEGDESGDGNHGIEERVKGA